MSVFEDVLVLRQVGKRYRPDGQRFGRSRPREPVLRDVSLSVRRGELFGLVGESGCGKSTLGRAIVRLFHDFTGDILLDGENTREMGDISRKVQIVFQDPSGSLNPRKRIGWILEEPLRIHRIGTRAQRVAQVNRMLERVGLDSSFRSRFPHELSGGQRQRVSIGCALMLEPRLLVADEPVSALDVSVQAQILNLMRTLHAQMGLSMLFISHNLDVVYHLCDRVAVMYRGEIVELARAETLYDAPAHPYTQLLLEAVPRMDAGKAAMPSRPGSVDSQEGRQGDAPVDGMLADSKGCAFSPRCPHAIGPCSRTHPPLERMVDETGGEHLVRCHLRTAGREG